MQRGAGRVSGENAVAFARTNVCVAVELCARAREARAEAARLRAQAERLRRPRRVRLRGLVLFGTAEDIAP